MKSLLYLKDIKKILDEHKVSFWLEHGSLLGAVREGKIITGDDDIDLATNYEPLVANISSISKQLYNLGYDTYMTDVKLTIKKDGEHLSLFIYQKGVIPGHLFRYRVSKKDVRAHMLLYGFLEGLKTPYKDLRHHTTPKQKITQIMKRTMMFAPAKKQLHKLIIEFGKKIDCLFTFDIAFPEEYIKEFKEINFHGVKVKIPIESKKYLRWMYGKDWAIPDNNYDKQWGFYKDMEDYNNTRELKQKLQTVVEILNNHKIHFWMYGGSLLGYVRNGKLIPWDKDVDLFVWKKDYHKVMDLKEVFKKEGFNCLTKDGCVMLKWADKNMTIAHYTLNGDEAFLEKLCTRNKIGNIIYFGLLVKAIKHNMKRTICFLKWFLLKTNSAYKIRQVVPSHFYQKLKTINVLGVDLKVPAETEEYLEYTFGEDWRTPIKNFQYTKEYIFVIEGKKPSKAKYHSNSIR